MATPKKLPSGNWRVQVFSHMEGDKRKYRSFTASTKAEAARMAAEYQTGNHRDNVRITVKACVAQYIDSKKGVLSPSTILGYTQNAKNFAPIDRYYISDLTSADLQYFVSCLSENHSPKSVRNIYSLLMSAIKQVDDRRFRVTLPSKVPNEYHIPTDADVKMLLDSADHYMKIAILLAAVGTLRRGEICALEYSDVLYDFNAVYVHRSAVRGIDGEIHIKETPKTSGSVRRVALPKDIIRMIGHGEGRVYPFSPNTLTDSFVKLRKSVNLQCRFHDLRHYAASIMHAIGIPDQYIMERGGWSSDRILKEVYRNVLTDKSSEFTKKTNEYFEKNITRDITRRGESA